MLNIFAKRKLSRQLSEYLDSEAVQKLLDGSALDTQKIQSGRFEFVFVFVRADSPEQLAVQSASDLSRTLASSMTLWFTTWLARWSSWLSAHSRRHSTRPRHAPT